MRLKKLTATAVLAIGATGITAGTAYAQPAQIAPAQTQNQSAASVHGVDHGVGYTTEFTPDRSGVATTLDAGSFVLSRDSESVRVLARDGAVMAELPLAVQMGDRRVSLNPVIDHARNTLTLTPVGLAKGELKDIGSQQWFFNELQRASLGGIVGAVIGFVVGLFFVVGFLPGAVIGGIIGLLVAGGQPLIDSGIAYFSGRP